MRNSRTAVIVIPTYKEAASIGTVLEEILRDVVPATSWDCQVLVVDGNSPDGTAEIVREAGRRCSRIHLLVEDRKEGLGAAYFKGFRHAMSALNAGAVVE